MPPTIPETLNAKIEHLVREHLFVQREAGSARGFRVHDGALRDSTAAEVRVAGGLPDEGREGRGARQRIAKSEGGGPAVRRCAAGRQEFQHVPVLLTGRVSHGHQPLGIEVAARALRAELARAQSMTRTNVAELRVK